MPAALGWADLGAETASTPDAVTDAFESGVGEAGVGADVEADRRAGRQSRRARPRPWRQRTAAAVADRLPPTVRGSSWAIDGRALVVLVAASVGAVLVAVLAFGGSPRTDALVIPTFQPAPTTSTTPDATGSAGPSVSPGVVVIDVAGLVARPGVYELPAGARVIDALEAAGGAIEGTDLAQLNLARVLADGEQIAVGVPAAPSQPGAQPSGSAAGEPGAPLDLNTATEAELDGLPGVGPVLAARIVAWREENGRFTSVEELMEVSGIGDATFADLEPLVRV